MRPAKCAASPTRPKWRHPSRVAALEAVAAATGVAAAEEGISMAAAAAAAVRHGQAGGQARPPATTVLSGCQACKNRGETTNKFLNAILYCTTRSLFG
eukprot:COSAG06_NODE_6585_length_2867_cov_1.705564_3_plen_98_part_00